MNDYYSGPEIHPEIPGLGYVKYKSALIIFHQNYL
jgi:hypothetical protein